MNQTITVRILAAYSAEFDLSDNGINKQRVSKIDRKSAKASLISKIRTEENQRKDLDFLDRYSNLIVKGHNRLELI
ncbi:hypothetical protein BpHYR1_049757 [Brachionus plicatilis]|uniref:Uncharacterized protein n=1 Tax=Brachionus plicatilis TaxID=10195 RepID=A0A3M7RLN7_BRAPC|nr:hypothetical protein BpHYR1_049757 [Brachionus plicatilis]